MKTNYKMKVEKTKQSHDLINEIISDIENDRILLSQTLLKAQRLCRQTKNNELENFITKELEGYSENDNLPEYRMKLATPIGVFQHKFQMIIQEIPLRFEALLKQAGLNDNEINKRPIYFSISEMESFLKDSELKELRITFAPTLLDFARENGEANLGWFLKDAYFKLSYSTFPQIMISVKRNLIDTLLKIEAESNKFRISEFEVFFEDGAVFDASFKISEILRQAQKEIILIDNYVNEKTLNLFKIKNSAANLKILTSTKSLKNLETFIENFNSQYGKIEVKDSDNFHDRFIIIDGEHFFHFGASIKDARKRTFMFSQINEDFIKTIVVQKFQKEWNK
jgi:hypothetical protein